MTCAHGRVGYCGDGCDAGAIAAEAAAANADAPKGYYVTIYVEGCETQAAADAAVGEVLAGALAMAENANGDEPDQWDDACETVVAAITGPDGNVTMDVVPD